ncbi:MAG: hypothetical protein AABX19_04060 [Nanoarchaeota archaeon]
MKIINGLVVTVIALSSCDNDRVEPPNPEFYKHFVGSVPLPNSSTLYIHDLDGDGNADVLAVSNNVWYVAPNLSDEVKNKLKEWHWDTERVQLMTQEMRELSTTAMKSDQKLAYIIDKARYDSSK